MKKLLSPLLFIVCLNCAGQQFKIDSIGKRKNQTIELFCPSMQGQMAILFYEVRGMGKAFIFIGDVVTYYPERKRHKIQRNN